MMTKAEIKQARKRWISRFRGNFGEPPRLGEYTAGTITFEELYSHSIGFADRMVAEVQAIHSETLYAKI